MKTCKMRHLFAQNVMADIERLDSALSKMVTFRFAPQRFDTVLDVSKLIIVNVRPLVETLLQIRLMDKKKQDWCGKMLKCFEPGNLLLLAMIAELAQSASRFHHKFDNAGAVPTQIARTGYWFDGLKKELQKLFFFEEGREPLVLSRDYSAGFVELLRRTYNLMISESVIVNGKLVWYRPGVPSEALLRKQIASELGSIQNVVKLYLQALDLGDSPVASSLRPFDFAYWEENFADSALRLASSMFQVSCVLNMDARRLHNR